MHFTGIDWLRGVAAFFIVGCHIGLLDRTEGGFALTHFCDMNVGVFAAISGFLLQTSMIRASGRDAIFVLKKRIRRLLPIYVGWSLFYLLARWGLGLILGGSGLSQECKEGGPFWVWVVFGGGAACILWFIVNLLYVQTAICLSCWKFPRLIDRPFVPIFFAIGFLAWAIVDSRYIGYYTARLFAFVLLGWSIAVWYRKLPNGIGGWTACLAICLSAHFFLRGLVSAFALDFVCVIPILMLAISRSAEKSSVVGNFLASTSMGVYLWHPFFVVGLQRTIVKYVSAPYSASIILFAWIGTYALALATTVLIGKRCQSIM